MITSLASSGLPSVNPLDPCVRFSLRLRPVNIGAAGETAGVRLPDRIGARHDSEVYEVLCLGPDEWLIVTGEGHREGLVASFAAIAQTVPHALCDISDRELAYRIEGPGVLDLLAVACPLNLAKLPVGDGTRTVFDSVQVVLVREAEDCFRLECSRSFAPHVTALLERALREFASGY